VVNPAYKHFRINRFFCKIYYFGCNPFEVEVFVCSEAFCENPFPENSCVCGAKVEGLPAWVST
jgi:hypothetical protein